MAKVKFTFNDKQIKDNLDRLSEEARRKISAIVNYEAAYAVGWMKENAPWTDDTGAARSGLNAIHFSFGNKDEILLAYSVHYGIWLEIANNRKYEILQSAMRVIGDKLMKDLERVNLV